MLPELLVIFACVNSTGCSETSSAYYNIHPEIQQMVEETGEHIRIRAEKYVGPIVIQTVGPMIYAAAGGTGTIRFSKNISVQGNKKDLKLTFGMEF